MLGHLRRRTPSSSSASTPVNPPSTSSSRSQEAANRLALAKQDSKASRSSSLSSDVYFEAQDNIELSSFPVIAEAAGEGQTGKGHDFEGAGSFNPTWCDLCGDLVWGLYDTGASRCVHCNYTCHVKCQRRVRLNCSIMNSDDTEGEEDDGEDADDEESVNVSTLANISSLKTEEDQFHTAASGDAATCGDSSTKVADNNSSSDEDNDDAYMTLKDVDHIQMDHDDDHVGSKLPITSPEIFGESLTAVLDCYNSLAPPGQETVLDEEGKLCRGFIRVEMNLSRPINVVSDAGGPPSVYNLTKDDTIGDEQQQRTLTTFYLPPSTVKALHVTTDTTTRDVVQSLLAKFRVADNPHKYALYEKSLRGSCDFELEPETELADGRRASVSTLSRVQMRKLRNSERPLVLAMLWCRDGRSSERCFVLQENDPGEVDWGSFSLPELRNFLLILDREEAWYKKRIHERYDLILEQLQLLAEEKRADIEHEHEEEADAATNM